MSAAPLPVSPDPTVPNVCLVYTTLGRAEILSATSAAIARQTLAPQSVIVSCSSVVDAGTLAEASGVRVLTGAAGAARQRNRALRHLPEGTDIVVFFDDDFVPHPRWIEVAVEVFRLRPDVGAVTGNLIADGIKGPGISVADAFAMVEAPLRLDAAWLQEPYSPYGCNMAFRAEMIRDLYFDERLVLYGWLEDRDFGAALAQRGAKLVKAGAARGVHLGVKRGRVSGVRLGYSQIVNPIYMWRKGTMRVGQVADHILCNMASNLAKSARPEPYVDRAGRLHGNLVGLVDVVRGRLTPEKAAQL